MSHIDDYLTTRELTTAICRLPLALEVGRLWCNITTMSDNRTDFTELPHQFSFKNGLIFTVMWWGQGFLILMFFKWGIHGRPTLYWLMIPYALFGLVLIVRPNWIPRWYEIDEKIEQKWKKWNPPGFP